MPSSAKASHRRRALILVGLLTLIVVIAASDATHAAVRDVLEYTRAIILRHPNLGMLLFVLLAGLSGMLVFFSSAIIIPAAVYTWGRPLTMALLWVGWMLGGIASYLLGRYPGRRIFDRYMPARKIREYEKKISKETPFLVILLFQIALQSEIPGYVLGAARYSLRRYLAALALAEVPYAIGAIYLSQSFIGRNYFALVALGAAAILVSVIAYRQFHKRLETVH